MEIEVNSWDSVDEALRRMAEIDIEVSEIDGTQTIEINKIKESCKALAKDIKTERKELGKRVTAFCDANKAEFAKKRSKELNYGKIGYRLVRSVSIPRAKDKIESLITSLKAFGLSSCVLVEEKVDRDEIKNLDDGDIVKLGLTKIVKDSFRIEPKIEKVVGV